MYNPEQDQVCKQFILKKTRQLVKQTVFQIHSEKAHVAQKHCFYFSRCINRSNEKYRVFLLTLYCLCLWILKVAAIQSNTNKDKIDKFSDYYMKAGRHELDSCFHREEGEEQRRKVKHFYMK